MIIQNLSLILLDGDVYIKKKMKKIRICKNCNKEIENPKWNQLYCCDGCRGEDYDKKNQLKKKQNGCVICGFWRFTESHHIIKQINWGSNTKNNLVNLCPNHHKMADSCRYGEEFLKLLKKKTGMVGERLLEEEIQRVKNYIFKRLEDDWKDFNNGDFNENSYGFRREHRNLINQWIFYDVAHKTPEFVHFTSLKKTIGEEKKI